MEMRNPRRASFPNTHEPDGVEALIGDGIPLLIRDRGEIQAPLVLAAQIIQPYPRVHFVDDRMPGPGLHFLTVGSRLVLHDFPIIASITWTRTIFVMVAAGNVVA